MGPCYIRLQSSYFTTKSVKKGRNYGWVRLKTDSTDAIRRLPTVVSCFNRTLVLGLARVDLIDPVQDPALEVFYPVKPHRSQEIRRFRAPSAHLAVGDDVLVLRQLAERNEHGSGNLADLIFVRLADIEDEHVVTRVEALLQIDRRRLPIVHTGSCGLRSRRLGPDA